jgi:hypothetical protein
MSDSCSELRPERTVPWRAVAAVRQEAGLACELPSIYQFSVRSEKCVAEE